MNYRTPFEQVGLDFNWNITDWPAGGIGMHVSGAVSAAAQKNFSDIADMFPYYHGVRSLALVGEDFIAASLHSVVGQNVGGEFTAGEREEIQSAVGKMPVTHSNLVSILGGKWFSPECFTYIGPFKKPNGSWQHLLSHLNEWLDRIVLPDIYGRNRDRVLRALPTAPKFDVSRILESLWVLECEDLCIQGTAFALDGIGVVTCDHVVHDNLIGFRGGDPAAKYKAHVLKRNPAIDLAVIRLEGPETKSLEKGTADELRLLDHLMVAGFPNYRVGDSGIISPGLVTGFRPVSGVRRILTNASIIAGNSGGPVVGADGRVIGVAVTGAESPNAAHQTENHGVVPIDALSFL